jgi:hypothetical protein
MIIDKYRKGKHLHIFINLFFIRPLKWSQSASFSLESEFLAEAQPRLENRRGQKAFSAEVTNLFYIYPFPILIYNNFYLIRWDK